MGLIISSIFGQLFGKKEIRVLILGLDNAGKTTILYKLYAPSRVIRTMPTIGFNVETVTYKNLNFNVWDLGGQTNIRPYWRCYYANTHAIIYGKQTLTHAHTRTHRHAGGVHAAVARRLPQRCGCFQPRARRRAISQVHSCHLVRPAMQALTFAVWLPPVSRCCSDRLV